MLLLVCVYVYVYVCKGVYAGDSLDWEGPGVFNDGFAIVSLVNWTNRDCKEGNEGIVSNTLPGSPQT